jgi:hypothetical protein
VGLEGEKDPGDAGVLLAGVLVRIVAAPPALSPPECAVVALAKST